MKSRSPRVVANPSQPVRAMVGRLISSTLITTSIVPTPMKNNVVGKVQAIQVTSHPTQREAACQMLANEPDHDEPGQYRHDACRRQHPPVQS